MGPQFFVDGGFVCTYKGITRLLGRGSVRITPAHAGKRGTLPQGCTSQGDHPRACGEKSGDCLWNIAKKGSPPRVRGKEPDWPCAYQLQGITPARAGKSAKADYGLWVAQDHPRACGEKAGFGHTKALDEGSPPRVRGKGKIHRGGDGLVGITPARAGKRAGAELLSLGSEDHPRACGEKSAACSIQSAPQGSPPRVRGKEPVPLRHDRLSGITPARAGKS